MRVNVSRVSLQSPFLEPVAGQRWMIHTENNGEYPRGIADVQVCGRGYRGQDSFRPLR